MVVTDRFHCITKPVILLKTIIGRRHPIWPNTNCITQSEAFLDRFSFVILIRWKIYSALTQVVVMQALWNFAQKLCKILERYGILQWSYTKTNFLSNLNYDEMIVREMDTGFQMRCSLKISLSYQCFRIPQTAIFKWVRQVGPCWPHEPCYQGRIRCTCDVTRLGRRDLSKSHDISRVHITHPTVTHQEVRRQMQWSGMSLVVYKHLWPLSSWFHRH